MYRLIFTSGKMKGRRVVVQQGSIVIGRDPACHLELTGDDEAALRHAAIEERGGAYFVRSLDAANRLHVNGQPVSETPLKNGDKIEAGRTQFEFHAIQEQAPVSGRRSVSGLHIAAFVAVAAIIAAELFFVLINPLRQKPPKLDAATIASQRQKALAKKAATNTTPPAVEVSTNDLEMARARAVIDAMAAAASNMPPPVAIFTSPVPAAVQQPPPAPAAPVPLPQLIVTLQTNGVPKIAPAHATSEPPGGASAPGSQAGQEDPVLAEVRIMMQTALARASTGDLAQADQTFDRIQFMAPDYLPAYAERAKNMEKRGLFREAAAQWREIEKRAAGAPQATEARAEQQRMAGLELAAKNATPPPAQKAGVMTNGSKRIRILSVEHEKFQGTAEYDEMRVVRINLKSSDGVIFDPQDVRVLITFYDRNADTGKSAPTRVLVPENAMKVDGVWPAGETKSVTATYIVPKDFRAEELRLHRERLVYHGYRVQVFLAGRLADEDASPHDLIELPSPKLLSRPAADQPVGR